MPTVGTAARRRRRAARRSAVTRASMPSPERSSEPSSTWRTPSVSATCRTVSLRPLSATHRGWRDHLEAVHLRQPAGDLLAQALAQIVVLDVRRRRWRAGAPPPRPGPPPPRPPRSRPARAAGHAEREEHERRGAEQPRAPGRRRRAAARRPRHVRRADGRRGVLRRGRLAHGDAEVGRQLAGRLDSAPRAAWPAPGPRSRPPRAAPRGGARAIGVGAPVGLPGQHLAQVGAAERHPAGQHLVQHAAGAVDVAAGIAAARRRAPAPGSCRRRCRSGAPAR